MRRPDGSVPRTTVVGPDAEPACLDPAELGRPRRPRHEGRGIGRSDGAPATPERPPHGPNDQARRRSARAETAGVAVVICGKKW